MSEKYACLKDPGLFQPKERAFFVMISSSCPDNLKKPFANFFSKMAASTSPGLGEGGRRGNRAFRAAGLGGDPEASLAEPRVSPAASPRFLQEDYFLGGLGESGKYFSSQGGRLGSLGGRR